MLAPLATRELSDLYRLVEKIQGKPFSANALSHGYSGAEINEITATLERLTQTREVVCRVNQQYIASAAQADQYRIEPAFKLQGSYRNMNKLAEKISPVMNAAELQQMIADHMTASAATHRGRRCSRRWSGCRNACAHRALQGLPRAKPQPRPQLHSRIGCSAMPNNSCSCSKC